MKSYFPIINLVWMFSIIIMTGVEVVVVDALYVSENYVSCTKNFTQQNSNMLSGATVSPSSPYASVSISADGNTAVMGSPDENGGIGAAYVFNRSGTIWSSGTRLLGTPVSGTPYQGSSVSISGDGYTILIGAQYDSSNKGACWVFVRSAGTWIWVQQTKLVGTPPTPSPISYQGSAVALSTDGNTALVGATEEFSGNGAGYIFTRSGTTWSAGPRLSGTPLSGTPYQGGSVGLSGDGKTALLGAYGLNNNVGGAFVFVLSGGSWSQQGSQALQGFDYSGNPWQGCSVAISSNGNTVVVSLLLLWWWWIPQ
jgi:hypothetical protein